MQIQPMEVSDADREFAALIKANTLSPQGLGIPATLLGPSQSEVAQAARAMAEFSRSVQAMMPEMLRALQGFGAVLEQAQRGIKRHRLAIHAARHCGELEPGYFLGYLEWREEQGLGDALRVVRVGVGLEYEG